MGVASDAGVRATHQQQKRAVYRDGAKTGYISSAGLYSGGSRTLGPRG